MRIPTTAAQAVLTLSDVAALVDPRITVNAPAERGDDAWTTLTRRHPGQAGALMAMATKAHLQNDAEATGRLLTMPPTLYGQPWTEHTVNVLGNRGAATGNMFDRPAKATRRLRLSVLRDLDDAPATPAGSWALTLTALGARSTSKALDAWSRSLRLREGIRAREEARAYAAHATAAEGRLQQSFEGWLPDVESTTAPPPPERNGSSWI